MVSEETSAGLVPIEGALVDEYSCEDAPPSRPFFGDGCPASIYQRTTTDKNGAFRFSGLYGGTRNSIGASKEGFEDPLVANVPEGPDATDNSRKVTINGDTHYEIQLVRQ